MDLAPGFTRNQQLSGATLVQNINRNLRMQGWKTEGQSIQDMDIRQGETEENQDLTNMKSKFKI